MIDRVFCPVKSKWFRLIRFHRKTWEFRSAESPVGRQVLQHRSRPPAFVEFRHGYRGRSLWGRIDKIIEFSDPFQIPKRIMDGGCATPNILQTLFDHRPLVGIHFTLKTDPTTPPEASGVSRMNKANTTLRQKGFG